MARAAGIWVGRARRFIGTVQSDIHREINKSEELQRLLEEQSQIKAMHEIIEQTVDETRKTIPIGAEPKSATDKDAIATDVDSGLPAHEPRSLDDDTAAGSGHSGQAQAVHDTDTDKPKPAAATDAMNDPAK